jgi:heptosyltransferase-2
MKNKILIVGPAWVGDMVMAQCLFKLLKQRQPDVIIDVLAPAWSLPLLERMPEVASAIVLPFGHGQLALRERYQLGKSLRHKDYTQAILLPNSLKSALIPFFAKIPLRTGWRGEMRYGLLNDIRYLDKARYPLMIERFMVLGLSANEPLPIEYPSPELITSSASCSRALVEHQLSSAERPILALCPGAEFGSAKRWPAEYYAAVANAKLSEGWDVWLFGSAKDREVTERIMTLTQQRCFNLAGKTKLEEAVDLLSLTTAVVSNDSGLMHIAAALRKPLVVLYGPTSASFTPPLHQQARILTLALECQPCFQRECPLKHHHCMQELVPEMVLDAINRLIP